MWGKVHLLEARFTAIIFGMQPLPLCLPPEFLKLPPCFLPSIPPSVPPSRHHFSLGPTHSVYSMSLPQQSRALPLLTKTDALAPPPAIPEAVAAPITMSFDVSYYNVANRELGSTIHKPSLCKPATRSPPSAVHAKLTELPSSDRPCQVQSDSDSRGLPDLKSKW